MSGQTLSQICVVYRVMKSTTILSFFHLNNDNVDDKWLPKKCKPNCSFVISLRVTIFTSIDFTFYWSVFFVIIDWTCLDCLVACRLSTMVFSGNTVCIVLGFMYNCLRKYPDFLNYNCLLKYPDFLNYKSIPSLSSSSSMKSMSSSLQAWVEVITFSREIERKPGLK